MGQQCCSFYIIIVKRECKKEVYMEYIISNIVLLDRTNSWHNQKVEILIADGIVKKVAKNIDRTDTSIVMDGLGGFVSAGWIDLHTHCFDIDSPLQTEADSVGVNMGVTTIVDAGTAGCDTIDSFFEQIKMKKTRAKAFLNISKIGITVRTELVDLDNINITGVIEKCREYHNDIVGIKVRESGSVVGENGIKPLQLAQKIAKSLDLPIMVHIGNPPPPLLDIIAELKAGDIITHIYNGKDNNIFQGSQMVHPLVKSAQENGIIFDVGHGSDSFNFEVAQKAFVQGLFPNVISTDVYSENINGPVHSLAHVASKFFCLGLSLIDIIDRVTKNPAKIIGAEDSGSIIIGKTEDLTLFKVSRGSFLFEDSDGNLVKGKELLEPTGCFIKGQYYMVRS